jgi:4-carboxymuconolactone decarboxylase
MTQPSPGPQAARDMIPRFNEITQDLLFGEIWERPGLSKRDRSLITVAALTALYRTDQLRGHTRKALENGVTKEELVEVFQHMAFYAGWPCAVNGFKVADEVFEEE